MLRSTDISKTKSVNLENFIATKIPKAISQFTIDIAGLDETDGGPKIGGLDHSWD